MPSSSPDSPTYIRGRGPRRGASAEPSDGMRTGLAGEPAEAGALLALKGRDGDRDWQFVYDGSVAPAVSSNRVSIYRGTLLCSGMFPRAAVAKVFNVRGGGRLSAVKKAGMAFASGAGPAFCYSNCALDGGFGGEVLVEQDGGVSLREVLACPGTAVPGPAAGKPLFPDGAPREPVVRKVFFDVMAHLRALHAAGYAHCDVRPGNVVVRRFGPRPDDVRATLIDFESLEELGAGYPGYVNEYFADARRYLGRDPLPLEMDVYYAHMLRAQLLAGEAACTPDVARACEEALAGAGGSPAFALAGAGEGAGGRRLRGAGPGDFDALARGLDLVPVGDLALDKVPRLAAACGYLDYLACRTVREDFEGGDRLVGVSLQATGASLSSAGELDRLAVLATRCLYELRDACDGRVDLARFERWAREEGHALPDVRALGFADLEDAVRCIRDRGKIPGIEVDHRGDLLLVSEQVRAKQRINRTGKDRIAGRALDLIRACVDEGRDFREARACRPRSVYVDGGSTTEPVVEGLCRLIEAGRLAGLRIVTPSVHHACRISECFMDLGYDDRFDDVALYMAGGLVRPGTQSTVSQALGIKNQVAVLASTLGSRSGGLSRRRFDLALVGASRLGSDGSVTVTGGVSAENKRPALEAHSVYLVLDGTKLQDPPFAHEVANLGRSGNLQVITDADASNEVLRALQGRFPGRVHTV